MKISASLYSSKQGDLKELAQSLDQHGIDYFHIDCNDNPSVFDDIAAVRTVSNTPIDLHLITANPENYFDRINELGVELTTLQHEDLKGYRYQGGLASKMGLSVISPTDISVFDDAYYDFILLMATTPGQSGGSFDKINFRKIRQFKNAFPKKQVHVDGGVNAEVSFILRNMGVNASVVGSYLFKDQPVGAALLNLKTHEIDSHFLVGDFMRTRNEAPILGPAEQDFKSVLQSIEDWKMGFTMLEDKSQYLSGIVSNADLRREVLRNVNDLGAIKVDRMINKSPITINENTSVTDMLVHVKQFDFPINYLPVVNDKNQVKGVVSFLNLVKGEL